MNNITKILSSWRKPKVIIIENNQEIIQTISRVLRKYFKVGEFQDKMPGPLDIINKELLIININLIKNAGGEKFRFLTEKSSLLIFLLKNIKDVCPEEKIVEIENFIKTFPPGSYLIFNYDDENIRKIKNEGPADFLTFGFEQGADFLASDVLSNDNLNFKINYKKNVVPVWLRKPAELSEKEEIYNALAAYSAGVALGINLVEISQPGPQIFQG